MDLSSGLLASQWGFHSFEDRMAMSKPISFDEAVLIAVPILKSLLQCRMDCHRVTGCRVWIQNSIYIDGPPNPKISAAFGKPQKNKTNENKESNGSLGAKLLSYSF